MSQKWKWADTERKGRALRAVSYVQTSIYIQHLTCVSLGVISVRATLLTCAFAETKAIASGAKMGALSITAIMTLLLGKPREYVCRSVCVCVSVSVCVLVCVCVYCQGLLKSSLSQ